MKKTISTLAVLAILASITLFAVGCMTTGKCCKSCQKCCEVKSDCCAKPACCKEGADCCKERLSSQSMIQGVPSVGRNGRRCRLFHIRAWSEECQLETSVHSPSSGWWHACLRFRWRCMRSRRWASYLDAFQYVPRPLGRFRVSSAFEFHGFECFIPTVMFCEWKNAKVGVFYLTPKMVRITVEDKLSCLNSLFVETDIADVA